MSKWTRIDSEEGFQDYKKSLDKAYNPLSGLNHYGSAPDSYPCMTAYFIQENPNGADYCHHFFIYEKWSDCECPECGRFMGARFAVEEGDEF